jgi:hypothetical protein
MKTPLEQIAHWYSELNEFDAEHVGYRLSHFLEFPQTDLPLFLSTERLPISIQLGRVLAARAVIDWYIATDPRDSATDYMLDLVETGDTQDKRLANEALSRFQEHQQDRDRTRDTWLSLKKEELSDQAIQSWERESFLRRPLPE